jgi:hypothetical protein
VAETNCKISKCFVVLVIHLKEKTHRIKLTPRGTYGYGQKVWETGA